ASGTGCMKFMINGALTVGTLDGANVEMTDAVGNDNIFIFGLTAREVDELWQRGYLPMIYYNSSARLRDAIDRIGRGFDGEDFSEIVRYLLSGVNVSDPYMCLADFDSYYNVFGDAVELYNDRDLWTKKSMINIAGAGYFSSDRSIREYAEKIWHINSVKGMN
ncbi:MAG: glycogen/starch/alpha-glucan phosphorylase, partial [Clostridia bacterium]|nr:glycogen/starch/alpha-glucan phosphorylase [Clostridia bacterium]